MLKNRLMLATAASLILIGSACSTKSITVPMPLERPARPVLPKLNFEQAKAIPDDVWRIIVRRDLLRRQYAEQLETIIDGTRRK